MITQHEDAGFSQAEGSDGEAEGGEVDFLQDGVECLGLALEVVGGVGCVFLKGVISQGFVKVGVTVSEL
jgi:hypothetical protein